MCFYDINHWQNKRQEFLFGILNGSHFLINIVYFKPYYLSFVICKRFSIIFMVSVFNFLWGEKRRKKGMNSWMKTTRIKKYRKSRHRYRDIVMVKEKPIVCLVLTDVYNWNSFFYFISIYFTKLKINFIIIGLLNTEKTKKSSTV